MESKDTLTEEQQLDHLTSQYKPRISAVTIIIIHTLTGEQYLDHLMSQYNPRIFTVTRESKDTLRGGW